MITQGRDRNSPSIGPTTGKVGAGKVVIAVGKSGNSKKLTAAIETLKELVGRAVTVRRGIDTHDHWPPYHVEKIDYEAIPELRCVVMRTFPNGSREYIRRSIVQVTSERKYAEADAVIVSANSDELCVVLDAMTSKASSVAPEENKVQGENSNP